MKKTFIDELVEVNKRIPRRILKNVKGQFVTSRGQVVSPLFLHVDQIRIVDIDKSKTTDVTRPYFFQLGEGEYRGARGVNSKEAHIALGYDFKTAADDRDILAMLNACEVYEKPNAYYLGSNIISQGVIDIPVAYLKIPEKIHKDLAINPNSREFKSLIYGSLTYLNKLE